MKLLVITQAVDLDNPTLGFFHRWIEELAKNFSQISVICLEKGRSNLPGKVKVLSLGKENGSSRLSYTWRFFKYLWQERENYDSVFIHMNQEYILMAGWWWRLTGKKIYFWRNHPEGSFLTRMAVMLSNKVFCTSPQSYTARFSKTELMPVGIDTTLFVSRSDEQLIPGTILALGRISPVKRLEVFIQALLEVMKRGVVFHATIVGSPLSPTDRDYERRLHRLAQPLVDSGQIKFIPAVPIIATPDLYHSHEVYVNLTPSGSLDKTIFEAMACGTMVVASNQSLVGALASEFIIPESNHLKLAEVLISIFRLSPAEKKFYRKANCGFVNQQHSLSLLIKKLCYRLSGN